MPRVRLKHWRSMSLRWPRCCAAPSRECSGSRPLAWCPATSLRCQVSPLPQYRLANITCSLKAETCDRHGHWKQPQSGSEQPPAGLCDIGVVKALDMGTWDWGVEGSYFGFGSDLLLPSVLVSGFVGLVSSPFWWGGGPRFYINATGPTHRKIAHDSG